MRITWTLLLTVFHLVSTAQDQSTWQVDSTARLEALELINSNRATEVLIYNSGCIGCDSLDLCPCSDGHVMTFLFWKEGEQVMTTKFGCCSKFPEETFTKPDIWDQLQRDKKKIFSSNFKQDYIMSHYDFGHLRLIPGYDSQIRIYDYLTSGNNEFKN